MSKGSGKGFLTYERQFMQRTLSIYKAMVVRFGERKNQKGQVTRVAREIPFTLDEFRAKVESVFGPKGANPIQCRYCSGWITIAEMATDHEIPVSRGGSLELSNIGFPCQPCNFRKGKLLPSEWTALYNALQQWPDAARRDVLQRLEIAVQLAAKDRQNRAKAFRQQKPQQEETEQ